MEDTSLNHRFGALRPPSKVEGWERNAAPVSLTELNAAAAKALRLLAEAAQCKLLSASMRAQTWLWVLDRDAKLLVAVEELALQDGMPIAGFPRRRGYLHPSEEKKLGHPTLLNGGEARIAGELAFDEAEEGLRWVLNANSGRYCREIPPSPAQLDAVAEIFRSHAIDVVVDDV